MKTLHGLISREAASTGMLKGKPMEPFRVQLRRTAGWRMPENTKKVARPALLGNPFPLDLYSRRQSLRLFRALVTTEVTTPEMGELGNAWLKRFYRATGSAEPMDYIKKELRGINVACFCRLADECHGDILLELANS